MSAEDVLVRTLDAASHRVRRLGAPQASGDATYTDNTSVPRAPTSSGGPGSSLLAAPADHAHPASNHMRIAASGVTTLAACARVTLAKFTRGSGELFSPGGHVFVRDNVGSLSWESRVDCPSKIGTYHERTTTANELSFCAMNNCSQTRTIEWASVALTTW